MKEKSDYQCIKKLIIMQDGSMIMVTSHVQNAHQWRNVDNIVPDNFHPTWTWDWVGIVVPACDKDIVCGTAQYPGGCEG